MEERSRQWYNHSGLRFAETAYFFGAFEPCDYGCSGSGGQSACKYSRGTGHSSCDPRSPYIKNHIQVICVCVCVCDCNCLLCHCLLLFQLKCRCCTCR